MVQTLGYIQIEEKIPMCETFFIKKTEAGGLYICS